MKLIILFLFELISDTTIAQNEMFAKLPDKKVVITIMTKTTDWQFQYPWHNSKPNQEYGAFCTNVCCHRR